MTGGERPTLIKKKMKKAEIIKNGMLNLQNVHTHLVNSLVGRWIPINDGLPQDDNMLVVFVCFYKGSIVTSHTDTYDRIRIWRKFDLENNYTHWMQLPEIPK